VGQAFIQEDDGLLNVPEIRDRFKKIYEENKLMKGGRKSILEEPNKVFVPMS
jgi:hypothetical protein